MFICYWSLSGEVQQMVAVCFLCSSWVFYFIVTLVEGQKSSLVCSLQMLLFLSFPLLTAPEKLEHPM